uniref:lysozyme n=1 Tax=Glossina brevipalpis TaxID=37001 RepID=A0A1A9WIY7_9MUSC
MEEIDTCFSEKELNEAGSVPTSTNKNLIASFDTNSQKKGKIYDKCELAQELYRKYHMPIEQIPTWVCIAQHKSSFNTAAIGRLNADGSADHGLFQISDLYWCSHDHSGGKACNIPCVNLVDSDISDDVRCVKTIYDEHTRISGDGFTAWTVYKPHCRNKDMEDIDTCFSEKELNEAGNVPTSTNKNLIASFDTNSQKKGKIYDKCELAQELYRKYHMPIEQIPTWVCIAQHESSFNTSAISHLNADGSADHGLFQISDLYWCSHDHSGGKACNISCVNFLDSDISDDVRCVMIIYDEHTRISGDGFTAWTVYKSYCRKQSLREIRFCFSSQEVEKIEESVHLTKDSKKPKLYEAVEAAQDITTKQSVSSFQSRFFLSGFHNMHENSTIATVSLYHNNPFLNRSIKLQTKENDKQEYFSNPFLNGTSKKKKTDPALINSSTESSSYQHYDFLKVPSEKTGRINSFSPTTKRYFNISEFRNSNKPTATKNLNTTPMTIHRVVSTEKPLLTDIFALTASTMKIPPLIATTQAAPTQKATMWRNDRRDSLQSYDANEQFSTYGRIMTSTDKKPNATTRTTIRTISAKVVLPTVTTKQTTTKQSTTKTPLTSLSKSTNSTESIFTTFGATKVKQSIATTGNTTQKSSTKSNADKRTTSVNSKTASKTLTWSWTTTAKPQTKKSTLTKVMTEFVSTKFTTTTTKKPWNSWSTSKRPKSLDYSTKSVIKIITKPQSILTTTSRKPSLQLTTTASLTKPKKFSIVADSRTTRNPIEKSNKINKLQLSYDWSRYAKALNITNIAITTKQPSTIRASYNSYNHKTNTTLSTTVKWRTITTKSPMKANISYSTTTAKPSSLVTTPRTNPFDHPFFAKFKEIFKKNDVHR